MPIRVTNVTAQVLFIPSEIFQTVNDPITFVEEPFARSIRVSNLTVQILQLQSGRRFSAADTLDFEQLLVVLNAAGDRQVVTDTITFVQTVDVPSNPFLEDVLTFSQVARSSILNHSLSHGLGLHGEAVTCSGAPWGAIEVSDTLAFIQVAAKVELGVASDTITFTDAVANSTAPEGGGHALDLTQSVGVGKGYTLSSTLTFTHAIASFSDYLRSAEHSNIIEHAMTYYIDNGCNRKQYARFAGEGTAETIDIERLVFDSSFVLESISSGTVLVLRSPESDDGDRLGFNRINRETRGGELNVYGDPNWAEVNTLLFTITALPDGKGNCPDTLGATLQFLQDNLGQEIFLHDWTGTSWRGVITTPDEQATEDADGYWTINFEFEGVAEGGSVPNSVMAIQHALSFNADWNRPLADTLAFTQSVHAGGDLYAEASNTLAFTQSVSGTQEKTILFDNFLAGAAVDLNGTSPTTGTNTWRAHQEYQDDGTMDNPIDAGAYYRFTPAQGTVYQLTYLSANVVTPSDGDNCIFGFFEDQSSSNLISGPVADGTLNPTAAKAVHLMREFSGARRFGYRLGTDSDGTADTHDYTDATLRVSPDPTLDLRITLDTTGGAGNWTSMWEAKGILSGSYTEVGPETGLLSENIGAVGFSNDSANTDLSVNSIRLTELRPV